MENDVLSGRMIAALVAMTTLSFLAGCGGDARKANATRKAEVSRASALPPMAWDHRAEAATWTRTTLAAIRVDGAKLVATVPRDIAAFCPAYKQAGPPERAAFWAGMLSALAKHESTWNPQASGGGGRWIGLTQIDPRTARGYGCSARSVHALKNGSANLACAVRIAASQVSRDGALVGQPGAWRGMARDWAPFRSPQKRRDMAEWTRAQPYCQK